MNFFKYLFACKDRCCLLYTSAPYYISAYPNAGLPNSLGQYDQTPEDMAAEVKEYIEEGLVNIIGGCCGTTEQYIAKYQDLIQGVQPRVPVKKHAHLWLSGLELLEVSPEINFVNVGAVSYTHLHSGIGVTKHLRNDFQ